MTDNPASARRLLDAWNQGDVATVLALVTPDVEFETPGGVDRGPEAARQWVTKQTQPHVTTHIVLEQLLEAGDQVVVLFRGRCDGERPVNSATRHQVLPC